jgi:hypothetical protein
VKDKRIKGYEVICFYPGNKERLRRTWRLYGYLRNNQGITIAANENAKSLNSGETVEKQQRHTPKKKRHRRTNT